MLQTYKGNFFDLRSHTIPPLDVEDIAHSLGNLCRYNGHCSRFYSVAEHSVRAYRRGLELEYDIIDLRALLFHDAAEAYIGDFNGKLKSLFQFNGICIDDIEFQIQQEVSLKIGSSALDSPLVDKIDQELLYLEKHELILDIPHIDWNFKQIPDWKLDSPLGWSPGLSKKRFLECVEQVGLGGLL